MAECPALLRVADYKPGFSLALCTLAFLLAAPISSYSQSSPNILLIMADDMGFGDIGTGGNDVIQTPNLDSLATESFRFNHFYVSPVCAPTRASLLTGKYHQRTGVWSVTNGFETMRASEKTLAEILSDAGYATGLFGKWHLGENYPSVPHAQGFDRYIGFRTGHTEDYFDPVLEHNGVPYHTRGYITDVITDEAIRFMKEVSGKPFLCYVPFNAPHTPLDVPDDLLQKYRNKDLNERVTRIYAMMENLDYNVGRLLHSLKEMQIADNTIVIYLSDNGPIDVPADPATWRYNAGLRDQKFSIYEGGIRTRFFLRLPDATRAPSDISTPCAHIDVLPTLLDLCAVNYDAGSIDGKSLVPILRDTISQLNDRLLFLNYSLRTLYDPAPYPGGIVRWREFKMVNGDELYNLETDAGESRNLALESPWLLHRLDSAYLSWWFSNIAIHKPLAPISVGYSQESTVVLAPHIGRVRGGLQYFGWRGMYREVRRHGRHPTGVDSDWVTNWKSSGDTLKWKVQVVAGREYDFHVTLGGSISQRSTFGVSCGDKLLQFTVDKGIQATDDWMIRPVGKMVLGPGTYDVSMYPITISRGDSIAVRNLLIGF
jgi:arylsulfatase A